MVKSSILHSFYTSGSRVCELCKKDPVRQKCKDCDKLFCQQCSKNHKTLPACRNHVLEGLAEIVNHEKASLVGKKEELQKEQRIVDEKQKQMTHYKTALDQLGEQTVAEINKWYEGIVTQAEKQRDELIRKTKNILDAEQAGVADKERMVKEKQENVRESLRLIQEIQTEEDPAQVLGRTDTLRNNLDQRAMDDSPYNVSHIVIPSVPNLRVNLGRKWDETKAIYLSTKKPGLSRYSNTKVTFPTNLPTASFVKQREVQVSSGTKQILVQRGQLWCLYDDHIDIYDSQGSLFKSISSHIKNPNGFTCLPSGNVVIACMSMGLVEFTPKGKFVNVIAEGSMCDVSADHKLVYSLDYTDNKPVLKAFKKKRFKWRKVIDKQLQNDKCNTFNTLLTNQTSVFISATEENVLMEYTREGEMVSRFSGPRATRLCTSDTWGNILLTNHESNRVWLFKNDQTWHPLSVEGASRPYGVAVDEDGALWVSNTSSVVTRYTSQ